MARMGHDVFISYSSKDKPVADATCTTLEAHGIRAGSPRATSPPVRIRAR